MLKFTLAAILLAASLDEAQKAMEQKNFTQAAEFYQQYLEQVNPADYQARFGLARALAYAGRYQEAYEIFTALLRDFPEDPDILLSRGLLLGWMQRYEEASIDLKLLLSKNPDYTEAWQALADIYRWSRQQSAAEQHLSAWEQAQPQSPLPDLARATLYRDLRHFAKARESVQAAARKGANPTVVTELLSQIQRQPGALPWELQGFYEFQAFHPIPAPWHSLTLGIRHEFPQGSVALQSLTVHRFERFDQALVLDGYLGLWPRAFGNVRVQGALQGEVLPRWDILGELFQEFGDGWESALGYRHMAFNQAPVHFFQAGLGYYLGNFYLRLQPQLILAPEGPGLQAAFWTRYFFDSADNFLEWRMGIGRQIMLIGNQAQIQAQNSFFGLLNAQYFPHPQWGILGTLNYNYFDQYPHMYGFSAGTKLRW